MRLLHQYQSRSSSHHKKNLISLSPYKRFPSHGRREGANYARRGIAYINHFLSFHVITPAQALYPPPFYFFRSRFGRMERFLNLTSYMVLAEKGDISKSDISKPDMSKSDMQCPLNILLKISS